MSLELGAFYHLLKVPSTRDLNESLLNRPLDRSSWFSQALKSVLLRARSNDEPGGNWKCPQGHLPPTQTAPNFDLVSLRILPVMRIFPTHRPKNKKRKSCEALRASLNTARISHRFYGFAFTFVREMKWNRAHYTVHIMWPRSWNGPTSAGPIQFYHYQVREK